MFLNKEDYLKFVAYMLAVLFLVLFLS